MKTITLAQLIKSNYFYTLSLQKSFIETHIFCTLCIKQSFVFQQLFSVSYQLLK